MSFGGSGRAPVKHLGIQLNTVSSRPYVVQKGGVEPRSNFVPSRPCVMQQGVVIPSSKSR